MTAQINTFNDFHGLSQLKTDAGARSPAAAREAARQFEALFVQMMLKSMRDANAVLGEQKDNTYQEMFDKQIAMEMSQGKGLGLGDLMVRQLGAAEGATDAAADPGETPLPLAMLLQRLPAAARAVLPELPEGLDPELSLPDPAGLNARLNVNLPLPALPEMRLAALSSSRADFRPASREDFVREIWPLAVRAGEKLGVDPRAIVAQAALETGWGNRQIRDDAGISGNNLFGIKADSRWTGERVTVTTLEYEGGLPKPQRAQFRAYPDLAAGFEDYVRFLQGNPRYSEALRAGSSAHVYAERLQSAGYATDPRYAEKIRSIIDSPALDPAG
ncbi:MAG: flagellar assembly peptidoglycan hydrolase FlgJ [Gammaproteobacteria bacterium]|nr:flagellar assembly peptidoglycan hydrolase FlgJ [Gammaproteobacteria bacterium]